MKKMILLGLAVLVIALLASSAFASELDVWYTDNDVKLNPLMDEARAFKAGDAATGACNKYAWDVEWTTTASVAQWIEFTFTATEWNWYVRKPGDFYTDCIELYGKSNGDVVISFKGFDDLQYEGEGVGQDYIETYYYASPLQPDGATANWVRAADLNDTNWFIAEDPEHKQLSTKLWNRIVVVECNSASEYSNSGTITLTLQNQKDWIDGATGNYQNL